MLQEAQDSVIPNNTTVSIELKRLPFGNIVNATLQFGFRYDEIMSTYSFGFYQQFLQIQNNPFFAQALGFGYDEMREYPFAYTNSGMITDYWRNRTPNWISRRPYLSWTEDSRWGGYLGPISEENMTRLTYAGDIVEFENLTIYFEDGTSFRCGPQVITIGINFTRQQDSWHTQYILDSSELENVILGTDVIEISSANLDPISLPFLGVVIGVIVVVTIGVRLSKRKPRTDEPIQ